MRKILAIILGITMLFFVGCQGGGGDDEGEEDWKSGTTGVTLSVDPDSPPKEMWSGETHTLMIEARNEGAYPMEDDSLNVDLFFTGFKDRLLDGIPEDDSIEIEGRKTSTNPEGGVKYYETEFDTYLYEDSDTLDQDIMITACYPYKTFASLPICVDPDPTQDNQDSCEPSISGYSGGQGAPVAIKDAEVDSVTGKVRVTIEITNSGQGTAFVDNQCLSTSRSDENTVWLDGVYLGEEEMDCSPEAGEKVRMYGNEGRISCTYDGLDEEKGSYRDSLGVELSYNYKTDVSKTVTLKKME